MCALTPCGHPTPQLVTLRYSSWNRTGLLNILEKFLPKYHSTLQGIKLQTVFNKKVLLSYFLGRQSKSPGLSTFFPQGQAIKKNQVILISSYTSHLLESPCFVGGFYWSSRRRPKKHHSHKSPKAPSHVTPCTLQHKPDKALPFLLWACPEPLPRAGDQGWGTLCLPCPHSSVASTCILTSSGHSTPT